MPGPLRTLISTPLICVQIASAVRVVKGAQIEADLEAVELGSRTLSASELSGVLLTIAVKEADEAIAKFDRKNR